MPATDAPRPAAEALPKEERGSFPSVAQFFGWLLIYFTLQIILRVWISPSLDLDESEQLVLTQKLSWGYGSQPPLYTWMQFSVFKIFGVSVFGLSLLKNILLFSTYLFTYLNARLITRRHTCAVAAAASLLFIPQIAWESQRDLTHSVLASTLACATLFCFLRMVRPPKSEDAALSDATRQREGTNRRGRGPSFADYAIFGLCAGLGVLSKYNFALVLAALATAAVSIREFRPVILNKRILLAGLIAGLIVLPNAWWALEHRELALRSAGKFKIQESSQWFSAIVSGFKGLLVSSATFFAPLAIVYGIIFWKRPGSSPHAKRSDYATLLLRLLLVSYGLIVLAVVIFRISDVRDRWLQPILIFSPVFVTALLQDRLNAARLKWILGIAGLVMVLVTFALHGRIIWAERLHRTQPLNRPYDALARQLKGAIGPASAVVTDTALLAGNLRLNIPDKIFAPPDLSGLFTETNGSFVLAWDAGGDGATRKTSHVQSRDWPPPDNLVEFARKTGVDLDPAQARYFSAVFKYHRVREMKVGVVLEEKSR